MQPRCGPRRRAAARPRRDVRTVRMPRTAPISFCPVTRGSMRSRIEARLTELRAELEAGRKMQQDLEARLEEVRLTMLRISGAIQVLSEMLTAEDAGAAEVPGA